MNSTKIILSSFLILFISSCVSLTKYRQLEERVNEISARPIIDLTDQDGDGVIDMIDMEPDTEAGCMVDTRGITLDSDADGIPDCKDREPYSPAGYDIDASGIAIVPDRKSISEYDIERIVDSKMSTFQAMVSGNTNPMDYLDFKEFKLPPPPTSKRKIYDIQTLFGFPPTFGAIDSSLAEVLIKAGYYDKKQETPRFSYFQVKSKLGKFKGYAIITQLEQTHQDGTPRTKRFDLKVEMEDYPWYVFFPPLSKGYFRSFAFLIVDDFYGDGADYQPTLNSFNENYNPLKGGKTLHQKIANHPISLSTKLHVLVYEYEKREGEKDGRYNPESLSKLNAESHLSKAKILKNLIP